MEIEDLFRRHHGVMRVRDVLAAGISRHRIDYAVTIGRLVRVHHGVVALPTHATSSLAVAHATRGIATCLTALRAHKVWVPLREEDPRVHLAIRPSQADKWGTNGVPDALKHRVVTHRLPRSLGGAGLPAASAVPLHPASLATLCAESCCRPDELFAVVESALRMGVPLDEFQRLVPHGGERFRKAVAAVSSHPASGSGAESLVAYRLRGLRVKFGQQVQIGAYRVDFLIGERLILEIDGMAHHGDARQFRLDRVRDRYLHARGYVVLRFTALEVMADWARCEAELLAFIRSRAHRRRRVG